MAMFQQITTRSAVREGCRSAGRKAPAWQKRVGIVFLALPSQMSLPAHHMFHTQYSRWMLKGFINSSNPDF